MKSITTPSTQIVTIFIPHPTIDFLFAYAQIQLRGSTEKDKSGIFLV
jgi:hypothetical protein